MWSNRFLPACADWWKWRRCNLVFGLLSSALLKCLASPGMGGCWWRWWSLMLHDFRQYAWKGVKIYPWKKGKEYTVNFFLHFIVFSCFLYYKVKYIKEKKKKWIVSLKFESRYLDPVFFYCFYIQFFGVFIVFVFTFVLVYFVFMRLNSNFKNERDTVLICFCGIFEISCTSIKWVRIAHCIPSRGFPPRYWHKIMRIGEILKYLEKKCHA